MEKTSNSDISTNQFIIVRIGNEQYGINIKIVDNIVRMQQITRAVSYTHLTLPTT